MKTRNILYVLTLIAYTLFLAHSVIPHHHHKTAEEAAAHTNTDHHHSAANHHHDHDKNDTEEKSTGTGHFFLFSHDINADVLIKHSSIDHPVKIKKTTTSVLAKEQIISFAVMQYLVFHPPQDDPSFDIATLPSSELRGPPYLLI